MQNNWSYCFLLALHGPPKNKTLCWKKFRSFCRSKWKFWAENHPVCPAKDFSFSCCSRPSAEICSAQICWESTEKREKFHDDMAVRPRKEATHKLWKTKSTRSKEWSWQLGMYILTRSFMTHGSTLGMASSVNQWWYCLHGGPHSLYDYIDPNVVSRCIIILYNFLYLFILYIYIYMRLAFLGKQIQMEVCFPPGVVMFNQLDRRTALAVLRCAVNVPCGVMRLFLMAQAFETLEV